MKTKDLRVPADPALWRGKEQGHAHTEDLKKVTEIRWGDTQAHQLVIPNASAVPVASAAKQIVDIRQGGRVWTVALALEWANIAQGQAGETMQAIFIVEFGVGSGRISSFQQVLVPFGGLSTANLILPNVPAGILIVSGNINITPAAAAARVYLGKVSAMAAPINR